MSNNFYNSSEIENKYDSYLERECTKELIAIEQFHLKKANLSEENIVIIKSAIKEDFLGYALDLGSGIYNITNIPIEADGANRIINLMESPDFYNKELFLSWLKSALNS